jgi:hypothetical protein
MSVLVYSHRGAREILEQRCEGRAFAELMEVVLSLPIVRHAGKADNPTYIYLQTCMNSLMNYVMCHHYGWQGEVNMPGGLVKNRVDFYKVWSRRLRIWMEVEFGNNARADSDLSKLRMAAGRQLSDVNVLVVPTWELAKKMDSGVATFDRVVRVLNSDKGHDDVPCLVIGVEEDLDMVVDVTDWGFSIEALKGTSKSQEKDALCRELWSDLIKPKLPADNHHLEHLSRVKVLDVNPGLLTPLFRDYCEEQATMPVVDRYTIDGLVTPFKAPDSTWGTGQGWKAVAEKRAKVPQAHVREDSQEVGTLVEDCQRSRVLSRIRRKDLVELEPEGVEEAVAPAAPDAVLRKLLLDASQGLINLPATYVDMMATCLLAGGLDTAIAPATLEA